MSDKDVYKSVFEGLTKSFQKLRVILPKIVEFNQLTKVETLQCLVSLNSPIKSLMAKGSLVTKIEEVWNKEESTFKQYKPISTFNKFSKAIESFLDNGKLPKTENKTEELTLGTLLRMTIEVNKLTKETIELSKSSKRAFEEGEKIALNSFLNGDSIEDVFTNYEKAFSKSTKPLIKRYANNLYKVLVSKAKDYSK